MTLLPARAPPRMQATGGMAEWGMEVGMGGMAEWGWEPSGQACHLCENERSTAVENGTF